MLEHSLFYIMAYTILILFCVFFITALCVCNCYSIFNFVTLAGHSSSVSSKRVFYVTLYFRFLIKKFYIVIQYICTYLCVKYKCKKDFEFIKISLKSYGGFSSTILRVIHRLSHIPHGRDNWYPLVDVIIPT